MIFQPTTDKPHGPPTNSRSWAYLVTFVIAALVAAIVVAFFLIGLADGSVSSFNITLWLGLLAVVGVVLFAGARLRSKGRTKSAIAVLLLLALPGVLYALFILLVIFSGARWN
jgi:hypothetical protein